MSERKFSDFMSNKCDAIRNTSIPVRTKVCPDCVPNDKFIEPGWFVQEIEDPYYDERTCEFCIIFESDITISQIAQDDRYASVEEYIRKGYKQDGKTRVLIDGLRKMANFYNKKPDDSLLCALPGCMNRDEIEDFKEAIADVIKAMDGNDVEQWLQQIGVTLSTSAIGLALNPTAALAMGGAGITLLLVGTGIELYEEYGQFATEEELLLIQARLQPLVSGKSLNSLRTMYKNYSTQANLNALEWHTNIEWIHNGAYDSPIRIKLCVPKFRLEALPDPRPRDKSEQEELTNPPPGAETIQFETWEFIEKKLRFQGLIKYYAKFYDSYFGVERGYLHFADKPEAVIYPTTLRNSVYEDIQEFGENIERFCEAQGYAFRKIFPTLQFSKTKVDGIKLGFDTSDENNPYKLSYIDVKPEGCDYKRIGASQTELAAMQGDLDPTDVTAAQELSDVVNLPKYLTKFNEPKPNKINVLAYYARLNDLDDAAQAPDPPPWTDVMQEYTFPVIEISDEATLLKHRKTDISCGIEKDLDLGNMFANAVDFVENLFEMLAFQLNQEACRAQNERNETDPRNLDIAGGFGFAKLYARPDNQNSDTKSAFMKEYESKVGYKNNGDMRDFDLKAMKEMGVQRALKELDMDDTLLLLIVDHFRGNSKGKAAGKIKGAGVSGGSKALELLQKISMCDMTKLFQKVLKCILAGIPFEQAMQTIIQTLLGDLSLRHIPKLIANLPADKQLEIERIVEQKIGSLPSPWSPNYKSGTVTNKKVKEFDIAFSWKSGSGSTGEYSGEGQSETAGSDMAESIDQGTTEITENQKAQAVEEASRNVYEMEQGTYGKAAVDITQLILQAYLDAILENVGVQDLINLLNKLPVAKVLLTLLKAMLGYCPTKPLFSPSPFAFLKSLTFSVCDPTIGLKLPVLPKLRMINILKFLMQKVKELIITAIVQLIIKLILKAIMMIETILCKALEMLGRLLASPLTGESIGDMLRNLLKDFLCDNEDELQDLMEDMMKGSGIPLGQPGFDPLSLTECFGLTISTVSSKREMMELMSGREKDQQALERMAAAVKAKCPDLADYFGDPEQIGNFFDTCRSFLPGDVALAIRENLDDAPDSPAFDSICISDDDFDRWNQLRKNLLEDYGLSPDEASDLLDDLNDNNLDALGDIANVAAGNLPDMLADEVAKILDDDPCNLIEDDMTSGSAMPDSNSSFALKDSIGNITDYILNQIANDYQKEIDTGTTSVNRILSDTQGNSYRFHRALRRFFLTKGFYYDSPEQEEAYEAAEGNKAFWDLFESRGFYPYTIGASCRDQIIKSEESYSSKASYDKFRFGASTNSGNFFFKRGIVYKIPSKVKPSIKLEYSSIFEDENDRTLKRIIKYGAATTTDVVKLNGITFDDWEDTIKSAAESIKDGNKDPLSSSTERETTLNQNFDYTISVEEQRKTDKTDSKTDIMVTKVKSIVDEDTQALLDSMEVSTTDDGNLYRVKVFNHFINSKMANVSGFRSLPKSNTKIFDKVFQNLYDYQKICLVSNKNIDLSNFVTLAGDEERDATKSFADESAEGFTFGYELEDVTEADLEYVGPDGEEYEYEEEDKILGRSATNHPRVIFLNPDIHGGRYTKPKIWIEPTKPSGWLGFVNTISPLQGKCEPHRQNLLNIPQIKERVDHVKKNTSTDRRLYKERYCAREIPFDRILDKDTKATLEGVILATIRVFITDALNDALPVLSNIYYSNENFNTYLSDSIYEDMKSSMVQEDAWFAKIERRAYWYLFLEQVAQTFATRIQVDGYEPQGEIAAAMDRIRECQINYRYPDDPIVDDFQTNGEDMHFYTLGPQFDFSHENKMEFINGNQNTFLSHSLLFMAFGDTMFATEQLIKGMNVSFIDFFAARELRMASKAFTIRLMEEECKLILMHMINEEVSKIMANFYASSPPAVYNLKQYLLSKPEIFAGSELDMGTREYFDQIATNEVFDPGNVMDITPDALLEHPLSMAGIQEDSEKMEKIKEYGQFYLEKYITFPDEILHDNSNDYIKFRPNALKGKANIDSFKEYLSQADWDPEETSLSDLFGNLEFIYPVPVSELYVRGFSQLDIELLGWQFDERSLELLNSGNQNGLLSYLESVTIDLARSEIPFDIDDPEANFNLQPTDIKGDLGLKYGLRLCYIPPESELGNFSSITVPQETIEQEKTYILPQYGDVASTMYSIPLMESEYKIIDETISEFLSNTATKNEIDMHCLVEDMINSPEFKLIFDNCISIKATNSIVLSYVMTNFVASIGENDGWEVEDVEPDPEAGFSFWSGRSFDDTKSVLRRSFAGLYNNQEFEDSKAKRLDLFAWARRMRGLEFKFQFGWLSRWLSRQLVTEDPFDANGEECGDQYAKLF